MKSTEKVYMIHLHDKIWKRKRWSLARRIAWCSKVQLRLGQL